MKTLVGLAAIVLAIVAFSGIQKLTGTGPYGDDDSSAKSSQPKEKVGGNCYFKVISSLSKDRLRSEGIKVIGSVNLTMSKYAQEACDDSGASESVDDVADYAVDKAVIDQSGL